MATRKATKPTLVLASNTSSVINLQTAPEKSAATASVETLRRLVANTNNREQILRILFSELPVLPDEERNIPRPERQSRIPLDLLPAFLSAERTLGQHYLLYRDYDAPGSAVLYERGPGECVVNCTNRRSAESWIGEMLHRDLLEPVLRKGLERLARGGRPIINDFLWAAESDWNTVNLPDEATEPMDARVFAAVADPEASYVCSTPTTEALGEQHPKGLPIIFREDVEPQEGAIVLADVTTQYKGQKRFGDGNLHRRLIRRYASDPGTGTVTLSPLREGFDSFTEGKRGGDTTIVEVQGVATSFKVTWFEAPRAANTRRAICSI